MVVYLPKGSAGGAGGQRRHHQIRPRLRSTPLRPIADVMTDEFDQTPTRMPGDSWPITYQVDGQNVSTLTAGLLAEV